MMIAVMNNLPEMILGACFAGVMFYVGRKSTRWMIWPFGAWNRKG